MHHGVAILSRVPLAEDDRFDWQANREARHVGVRLANGVRLENVYVPAGGDIPDREVNPKFGQKLDFVERMTRVVGERSTVPTILVGDFNIAPLECDVWSHKQLLNVVSHTPIEVEALEPAQGRRTTGSISAGISIPRRRGCTPGGAIARPTGRSTTAAGGSTICGRPPMSPPRRPVAHGVRGVPQLAQAVGPCADHDRVRLVSDPRDVARAIDALRRGWPIAIRGAGGRSELLAIETADAGRLAAFDPDGRRRRSCSRRGARRRSSSPTSARRRRPIRRCWSSARSGSISTARWRWPIRSSTWRRR